MNLQAIQQLIEKFNSKIKKQKLSDIDWLYEKQFDLRNHPTLNADNLHSWLTILFSSERTQRYWKSQNIRSAELMTAMAQFDPEMASTAFRDLFDEDRDLEGRIDRFKFYFEEVIARMRKNDKTFLESWHHQDNAIISYYLAMTYPTQYCYYTRKNHLFLVSFLGAKPLGEFEDPVRYQKMVRTISKIIFKDTLLPKLHLDRFRKPIVIDSILVVYEMIMESN